MLLLTKAKNAEIAQLVEHDIAKVGVASSSLVFRSKVCSDGGMVDTQDLKSCGLYRLCGFKSRSEYNVKYISLYNQLIVRGFFVLCVMLFQDWTQNTRNLELEAY